MWRGLRLKGRLADVGIVRSKGQLSEAGSFVRMSDGPTGTDRLTCAGPLTGAERLTCARTG